eukprot:SAG11_NODE_33147_length_279_cov_0.566667_1_plen_30_part_10
MVVLFFRFSFFYAGGTGLPVFIRQGIRYIF